MRRVFGAGLAAIAALALAAAAFVYFGFYNVAADAPHWQATTVVIDSMRRRSVAQRSAEIKVPDLAEPKLRLNGAGQYAEMCVTCHLAPGVEDTELRKGLYPRPPNLAQRSPEPKAAFWIIKHGVKMSGMPAWGVTHDDETIWSLVAFLQELPRLTAEQYNDITAKAPAHGMPATPDATSHPQDRRSKPGHTHAGHPHKH
jgi:mono/diheme cytochrome c family protein